MNFSLYHKQSILSLHFEINSLSIYNRRALIRTKPALCDLGCSHSWFRTDTIWLGKPFILYIYSINILGRTRASKSRESVKRSGKEESIPIIRCREIYTEQYQVKKNFIFLSSFLIFTFIFKMFHSSISFYQKKMINELPSILTKLCSSPLIDSIRSYFMFIFFHFSKRMNEETPSTSTASKKKKGTSSGFGNFSSWN